MRRFLSIILCVMLIAGSVCSVSITASAKESDVATSGYTVMIESYEQLKNLLINSPNGDTYVLQNDIIVKDNENDNEIEVGAFTRCVLDLNGYTLSRETRGIDSCLITVRSDAYFTVVDSSGDHSGKMIFKSGNYSGTGAVIVANGYVNIHGGSFRIETPYEVGGGVVFLCETGLLNIYDGVFDSHEAFGGDTIDLRHLAPVYNVPHCNIYGGTFYGKITNFEVSSFSNFASDGCLYPSVHIYDGEFYIAQPDNEYAGFAYCNNGWGQVIVAGGTTFYKCLNSSDQRYVDGVSREYTNIEFAGKTGGYYEVTPPVMICSDDLSVQDRLTVMLAKKELSIYGKKGTVYQNNKEMIDAALSYIDTIEVPSYIEESPLIWLENTDDLKTVSWYMCEQAEYDGENTQWTELTDYAGCVQPFRFDFRPEEETTLYIRSLITTEDGKQVEDVVAIYYEEFQPNPPVTMVEVVGVDAPAVGAHPDFDVSVVDDAYKINGIFWTDVTTSSHVNLKETDVFEAGHTYQLEVWLRANEGYKFQTDTDGWIDITATIGGKGAEVAGNEIAVILTVTYTLNKPQVVSFVDVSEIDTPVAGELPDMEAYCSIQGCNVDTVEWYDVTDGTPTLISADTKFVEGRVYRVVVSVVAEGNTTFEMVDGYNEATGDINGNTAIVYGSHDERVLELGYEFPACQKGDSFILGDVDGDGKVSVLDAAAIQRHIASIKFLTDDQLKRADTDKDGKVSVLDAAMIQRLLAHIITEF